MEVTYGENGWKEQMIQIYRDLGICIIKNVYASAECDVATDRMIKAVEDLGSGVSRADPATWNNKNLPSRVRAGMFQSVLSNHPTVWDARCNPKVYEIFTTMYTDLRGEAPGQLITSIDGVNLKHAKQKPFHKPPPPGQVDAADWAHLDQTDRSDKWKCIQGQLVLTNTTACFRASPGSHRVFTEILDSCGVPASDTSNWCKFTSEKYNDLSMLVTNAGGQWQVPIRAPKGSFIIWSSSTVHSAQFATGPEEPLPNDPYNGWRCVLYVSLRPAKDFHTKTGKLSDAFKKKRKDIVDGNRTTNHWGTTMFPKLVGGRHAGSIDYHARIKELHTDPSVAYQRWNINSPWERDDVKRMNGS